MASKKQHWHLSTDDDDGLLLVDLLSLHKKFSWKRYRIDIIGFSAAAILALLIVLLMIFLASICD